MKDALITFDPTNLDGMRTLMRQYGESKLPFFGENEHGESISISVFPDKIVTVTQQSNGHNRKNVYYPDGSSEELFEGRWDMGGQRL